MLTTACVLAVLVTVSAELASAATMQSGPVTYVKQTLGISPSTAGISTAACPENRPLSGGGVSWNVKAPGFDELDIGEIYGFDGADVGSIVDDGYRAYAINAGAKARDLTTWAACIKNSPPLINYTTTNYTMPATTGSGVDTASCFSGEVMGGGLNTNAPTADVVEFEAFHPKFDGAKLAPTEVTFALSKIGAAGAIDYSVQRFCSGRESEARVQDQGDLHERRRHREGAVPKGHSRRRGWLRLLPVRSSRLGAVRRG